MPQIQILPQISSPMEQLLPHLSQYVGQVNENLVRRRDQKSDQVLLDQLANSQTPMEMLSSFSQLSPTKQQQLEGIYGPVIREQIKQGGVQQQEQRKVQAEKAKKEEEVQGLKSSLQTLKDDLGVTGTFGVDAVIGKIPGTEAYEKRQRFDSLGFLVADKIFTHFNKGTISKEKLKTIKEDLAPRSDIPEKANKARINALEKIMGLPADISEDKLDSVYKKVTKSMGNQHPSMKQEGSDDGLDKILFGE